MFYKFFTFWIKSFTKWSNFNKKFTKCENSIQSFNNVSGLEAKTKHVGLKIEILLICQIWEEKCTSILAFESKYSGVSECDSKVLQGVKFRIKNFFVSKFEPKKLQRVKILEQSLITRKITNQNLYNVWIFQPESLRFVRFQKESFRTSLDFESKLLQRVRTWKKTFQNVGIGTKNFRRCQISHQNTRNGIDFQTKCYNTSDFESNALKFVGF